jgi:2-dehydropantoate 2-reductase
LEQDGSATVASMLRDTERDGPAEDEHVLGDMAERAARMGMGVATPILRLARCHVASYEARRAREQHPAAQ